MEQRDRHARGLTKEKNVGGGGDLPPPQEKGLEMMCDNNDKGNEKTKGLFSDILDVNTLPDGWERALYACMNDAGLEAATTLARLMDFGNGLEWVWMMDEEDGRNA